MTNPTTPTIGTLTEDEDGNRYCNNCKQRAAVLFVHSDAGIQTQVGWCHERTGKVECDPVDIRHPDPWATPRAAATYTLDEIRYAEAVHRSVPDLAPDVTVAHVALILRTVGSTPM